MAPPPIPPSAAPTKRRHLSLDYDSSSSSDEAHQPLPRPSKRRRTHLGHDLLSPLSDELLLRILSFLPLSHLLAVAPVSRRFYHLAGDSQLWKALYYARFVLPRAMRIPGFRDGSGAASGTGHKLHYSGRRTLWADGRRGGVVAQGKAKTRVGPVLSGWEPAEKEWEGVNWKRQFKIRYNWSKGKCAVEELRIGGDGTPSLDGPSARRILAKVVEGIAITADKTSGLRAWDLKAREMLAQIDLESCHGSGDGSGEAEPSFVTIDDARLDDGSLDIAVGFVDGGFGVWRLNTRKKQLVRRYRHQRSTNGELVAMAYSHPYLLTATGSMLISLYTFEVPGLEERQGQNEPRGTKVTTKEKNSDSPVHNSDPLAAPYLLTSLNSHTTRPPLALSIRKMATTTIASIAYTFSTRQSWSIGVQDLHIRPSPTDAKLAPEITTTRIAYTTPVPVGDSSRLSNSPPATPRRRLEHRRTNPETSSERPSQPIANEPGPTTLSYTHPYLLATLPDNTLVLYMCTSSPSSLSISSGIRLWGHTSGISDAEITARGRAVSVSSRGEEMRVWELEGRFNGMSGRSVEIRPGQSPLSGTSSTENGGSAYDWDEKRNWVGFDDEMVIVLKEKAGGAGESLMVYDFT
ncbi:F-box only protein 15 [Podospora conica]|nr:F-box only protein 15 [Schizothecium conicum]